MSFFARMIKGIKDPRLFIFKAASLGWFNWMDDATHLKMMYRVKIGVL